MKILKLFQIAIFFILFALIAEAQSIYSTVGFGRYRNSLPVRSLGMGGVSFAVRDGIGINFSNPSLWTNLPGASVSGFFSSEEDNSDSLGKSLSNTEFSGFIFHFPVHQRYGVALGMLPLSKKYSFSTVSDTLHSGESYYPVRNDILIKGGASLAFIGIGIPVSDRLYLGTRIDFLFSNTVERKKTLFTNTGEGTILYKRIGIKGYRLHLSWFYRLPPSIDLGGSVVLPMKLKSTAIFDFRRGSDLSYTFQDAPIPTEFNFGTGVNLNSRNLLSAEVNTAFNRRTDLEQFDLTNDWNFKSSYTVRLGYERDATLKNEDEWYNRIIYRLGVYSELNYIFRANEKMFEQGLSFGFGVPFQKHMNRIDLAFRIGMRDGFLGKESFAGFSLSFTSNEKWFIRKRK